MLHAICKDTRSLKLSRIYTKKDRNLLSFSIFFIRFYYHPDDSSLRHSLATRPSSHCHRPGDCRQSSGTIERAAATFAQLKPLEVSCVTRDNIYSIGGSMNALLTGNEVFVTLTHRTCRELAQLDLFQWFSNFSKPLEIFFLYTYQIHMQ